MRWYLLTVAIQSPKFVIMILSIKIRGLVECHGGKNLKKNPWGEGKAASLTQVLITIRATGLGVVLQFSVQVQNLTLVPTNWQNLFTVVKNLKTSRLTFDQTHPDPAWQSNKQVLQISGGGRRFWRLQPSFKGSCNCQRNKGAPFAQQTVRPLRGSDDHVKWRFCRQLETYK